jgi:hypothetical protein
VVGYLSPQGSPQHRPRPHQHPQRSISPVGRRTTVAPWSIVFSPQGRSTGPVPIKQPQRSIVRWRRAPLLRCRAVFSTGSLQHRPWPPIKQPQRSIVPRAHHCCAVVG